MKIIGDTTNAEKRLQHILKKLESGGNLVVSQLATLGKTHAQEIAPHNTGRTASFIVVYNTPQGKQIKAKNPTAGGQHRNSIGNYPNFNLVRWMHTSQRAEGHIKTGNPKFMYATRNYLNSIKKGVATGRFRNINLR